MNCKISAYLSGLCLACVLSELILLSIGNQASAQDKAKKPAPMKSTTAPAKTQPARSPDAVKKSPAVHRSKPASSSARKRKKPAVDERTQVAAEAKARQANARAEQERQNKQLVSGKEKHQAEQAGGKPLEHKGATMENKAKIERAAAMKGRNPANTAPVQPARKDTINN